MNDPIREFLRIHNMLNFHCGYAFGVLVTILSVSAGHLFVMIYGKRDKR